MKIGYSACIAGVATLFILNQASAQNIPSNPRDLSSWTGKVLKSKLVPAPETGFDGECPIGRIATFTDATIFEMGPDAGGDYTPPGQKQAYIVGSSMRDGKVNGPGNVAIVCWKDRSQVGDLRHTTSGWLIPRTSKLKVCYFPAGRVACR